MSRWIGLIILKFQHNNIVFLVFQFFPVMNVPIKKDRNSFSGGDDSGGGHRTLSFSFFFVLRITIKKQELTTAKIKNCISVGRWDLLIFLLKLNLWHIIFAWNWPDRHQRCVVIDIFGKHGPIITTRSICLPTLHDNATLCSTITVTITKHSKTLGSATL